MAEHRFTRSQDLENTFFDAGQFYWGTTEAFLKNLDPVSERGLPYVLSAEKVHDIDTVEDWDFAEIVYKGLEVIILDKGKKRQRVSILFRVDSGFLIGSGHLFRCIALADIFSEAGVSCIFLCRDLPGNMSDMVITAGYKFIEIPSYHSQQRFKTAGLGMILTTCGLMPNVA